MEELKELVGLVARSPVMFGVLALDLKRHQRGYGGGGDAAKRNHRGEDHHGQQGSACTLDGAKASRVLAVRTILCQLFALQDVLLVAR